MANKSEFSPLFKMFYNAFVQFTKIKDANKALEEHRYPKLGGAICRVLPFKCMSNTQQSVAPPTAEKKSKSKNVQLFIKGLPKEWSHKELHDAFEPFGKVISAKVSIDSEHNSRGYGYVEFEKEHECQKALK